MPKENDSKARRRALAIEQRSMEADEWRGKSVRVGEHVGIVKGFKIFSPGLKSGSLFVAEKRKLHFLIQFRDGSEEYVRRNDFEKVEEVPA